MADILKNTFASITEITIFVDQTKITSGTVKCYVKNGYAFLSFENVKFSGAGSHSNAISDLPKAKAFVGFLTSYSNGSALIADTTCIGYMNANSTTMSFYAGSTSSSGHFASVVYPVA